MQFFLLSFFAFLFCFFCCFSLRFLLFFCAATATAFCLLLLLLSFCATVCPATAKNADDDKDNDKGCKGCAWKREGVGGGVAYKNGNDFGNVDAAADCSQVSIVFGNFLNRGRSCREGRGKQLATLLQSLWREDS